MKCKLRFYKLVLEMILKDREQVFLTGKQKSQLETLIWKIDIVIKQYF